MNKKRIILSSLGAITIMSPIVAAVSCSTSWTKWSKDDSADTKRPTYNFAHIIDSTIVKLSKLEIDALKLRAIDTTNKTLNMDEVKNVSELIALIGEVFKFRPDNPIDSYYQSLDKIEDFANNLANNPGYRIIKTGQTEVALDWDISSAQQEIINGIHGEGPSAVEITDVKDNMPDTLTNQTMADEIVAKGLDFLTIGAVKELLTVYPEGALRLSKLLNLPEDAFNGIKLLLEQLDSSLDKILATPIMTDWEDANGDSIDLKNFKGWLLNNILLNNEDPYDEQNPWPVRNNNNNVAV